MKSSLIALFFKGMAMGTVDIVPGVSGSTVAVLLGIYERFIAALKNIGMPLFRALLLPFKNKFSAESRRTCKQACIDADLPWLLILLSGLATAFVVASFVIPTLMEKFPQIMRGVFFGLVLGSIITPVRSIKHWGIRHIAMAVLFAAGFFFLLGLHFSPPVQVEPIVSQGQTLEEICLQAPCFNAPAEVYAIPENAPLREIADSPAAPIPEGTQFFVQKPYFWYCLIAGFMAICAMLLPGISGSFVLLILGSYYFMLNTGKGFLHALAHGSFYPQHLLYLCCFVVGALTGIACFSRLLTWVFKNYRELTLAAIIGILIGCTRAVWPYRITDENGISTNILPGISDDLFWPTLTAIAAGLGIVVLTVIIQIRIEKRNSADKSPLPQPSDDKSSSPDLSQNP